MLARDWSGRSTSSPCTTPDFCEMPPNFNLGLEYEKAREGKNLTFWKALEYFDKSGRKNIMGLLLLSLAWILYHCEDLRKHYCERPNHPFHFLNVASPRTPWQVM